jgi:hypothetical protein
MMQVIMALLQCHGRLRGIGGMPEIGDASTITEASDLFNRQRTVLGQTVQITARARTTPNLCVDVYQVEAPTLCGRA